MKLNREAFRDKVYACWVGKNIGGTMGAPYEGKREIQDIQGFVTKPNEVLPNDDLDIQIVWLRAVENLGPYDLDCQKLGECWLSFIGPYWNEYGIGKVNLQRGLPAPLSGDYRNNWKNSNGAWIRTEIWAALCPGAPDLAAKYAVEDAKVDHGAGEGTPAAAFVAALQSAAYVLPDIRACIDVALEKIPETSRVAASVRKIVELYDQKVSWLDARNAIQKMNADIGDGWFEAPSNIAYTVLGLLYGEGDFKKSMILAIDCGDDTDCTGATVGSTLGILYGTKGIPEDWKNHIGDTIVTASINRTVLHQLPGTCTELTDRTIRQTPVVLAANGSDTELYDGKDEIPENVTEVLKQTFFVDRDRKTGIKEELLELKPYSFRHDLGFARATVIWDGAPDILPGESRKVTIRFLNHNSRFGNIPYNLSLRWILPEGFTVSGKNALFLYHGNAHNHLDAEETYTVTAGEKVEAVNRIAVEVIAEGRPTAAYLPLVLLG